MKLFFSLILLTFYSSVLAREIIVIHYHPKAQIFFSLTKKILREKLSIAPELITTEKQSFGCQKESDAIIQICIDKKGSLSFPIYKRKIIKRTFKWLIND